MEQKWNENRINNIKMHEKQNETFNWRMDYNAIYLDYYKIDVGMAS